MKKVNLKIHTSHLICGSRPFEIYNLRNLQDLFFLKKYKGVTIDITRFKSELIDVEYDEKNLTILKSNKNLKINKNEIGILNINKSFDEKGDIRLKDKIRQVAIFSDYLKSYLYNSKIQFYKKILFRNYDQVKNLIYDFQDPNFLDVIYLKNTSFFANEAFFKLELANYFLKDLLYHKKFSNFNQKQMKSLGTSNKTEIPSNDNYGELAEMIDEYYQLSLIGGSENDFISKRIKDPQNEFPNCLNHKSFDIYSKNDNEMQTIFELMLNRIKESNENLGNFYESLKKFYENYWLNQTPSINNPFIFSNMDKTANNFKNNFLSYKTLFNDNRYRFRREIERFFLDGNFSQSKQLKVFIDSLIFTFNDFDYISKLIHEFLVYIETNYDIAYLSLNINPVKKNKNITK